jgi:hypothetical protein
MTKIINGLTFEQWLIKLQDFGQDSEYVIKYFKSFEELFEDGFEPCEAWGTVMEGK